MKAGVCPCCNRIKKRQQSNIATCDCYRYCPSDHGDGAYGTLMEEYTPENVAPSVYGPIKTEGTAHGDIEHPMKILFRCPICNYHSSQQPVEVPLS